MRIDLEQGEHFLWAIGGDDVGTIFFHQEIINWAEENNIEIRCPYRSNINYSSKRAIHPRITDVWIWIEEEEDALLFQLTWL